MRPLIGLTGEGQPSVQEGWFGETAAYFRAVWEAGGLPVMLPPDERMAAEAAERLDGLVLTGGWDADPALYGQERHAATDGISHERDNAEIALIHAFVAADKPMLGICRGIQMLAAALGGSLNQHVYDDPSVVIDHRSRPLRHAVRLEQGSRLRSVYGMEHIMVNSTHHQAIERAPEGFAITAWSADGVIEGIERKKILGVQWHPERITDEGHLCLFEDFVRRCGGMG